MWSQLFIIASAALSCVVARPAPYAEEFVRQCHQGQKVLTVLKVEPADGEDRGAVIMPKCYPLEEEPCTRGCRWYASCDQHAQWSKGNGNNIFVAGFRSLIDESGTVTEMEAYCCETLAHSIGDCSWESAILNRHAAPVAGNGLVIRNYEFAGDVDSLKLEVCKAVRVVDICYNTDPGPSFQ